MRTAAALMLLLAGCHAQMQSTPVDGGVPDGAESDGAAAAHLPLVLVADAPLPGRSTRFDYQDVDLARGHLVIAHMNDGELLVVDLKDGAVLARLTGIPTARGVVVADEVNRIFVTSSPSQLVMIDNVALTEVGRVAT